MPVNKYACSTTVRDLCKSHHKCSKERHGGFSVRGNKLVQYCCEKGELVLPSTCPLPEGFDLDSEYAVCRYMHKNLSEFSPSPSVNEEKIVVKDTGRKSGKKNLFFFSHISIEKTPVKKRKIGPQVKEKNQDDQVNEENIVLPKNSSGKKRTHKEKFFEDVVSGSQVYRRGYRHLKIRQRVERVEEVAKSVMSACIVREKALQNSQDYFLNNEELQVDVMTFVGEVTLRLERDLKLNFRLEKTVTPSPDLIESETTLKKESGVEECGFFKKEDFDGDDEKFDCAIEMLGTMTMRGYTRLSNMLRKAHQIPRK